MAKPNRRWPWSSCSSCWTVTPTYSTRPEPPERLELLGTVYAKASTELSRTQIIAQAATAMLAQANQSQQSVLALLK